MIKVFANLFKYPIKSHLSQKLFGLKRPSLMVVSLFIGIALILAMRTLYTAPDDTEYILYFEGEKLFIFNDWRSLGDWWAYWLDEPLWAYYSSSIGNIFGAEAALRITILISSLGFLIASYKLTQGAWILIILIFIIDNTLATQMYYNQIRQGFALSVFLIMMSGGISLLLAAVVASLIHTSFIFVIPCVIATIFVKRSNFRMLVVLLAVVALTYYIKFSLGNIELGRREEAFSFEGKFNAMFYFIAFFQYGMVFYLLKDTDFDEQQNFLFRFSFIFLIVAISLSLIYEGAARLIYVSNSLSMILIGMSLKRKRAKIAAAALILLLLVSVLNEDIKQNFGQHSLVGRWLVILK